MSNICPNCSHPLRTDAKYCGFCGTNLTSPAEVKSVTPSVTQDKKGSSQNSKQQKQSKPKRIKTSQVVTIVAIILLFLLIILAVICRYWSEITQSLVQILSSLNVSYPFL